MILSRQRPFFLQGGDIPPYLVYTFLKELCGVPNGKPGSDRAQWCYELRVPGAYLRVRDWSQFAWIVDVYSDDGDQTKAEATGHEFIKLLDQQSGHLQRKAREVARGAQHAIIQNPFKLYSTSAEGLLELAENAPNQMEKEDLCRASFFLFLSSFEGLLNIVYDLYLKPFLNEDRIRRDLNRANIDLKLRLAPLYCACFSRDTIKYQEDELDRYLAIVELRNDFIHANLSPTMKTVVIKEDGYVFPIEQRETNKYNIPKSIAQLGIDHLRLVRQTIKDMAEAVINSMGHRFKFDFRSAIAREQIIVEQIDGENQIRPGL
jgi:hypothetical protein